MNKASILNFHTQHLLSNTIPSMDLNQLRQQIDELDTQLLRLLNERMDVVKKVGELKRANKSIIYRPEREKYIIDRLAGLNDGRVNRAATDALFLAIRTEE